MKNFKKNVDGITLIALVINIIVLLILAGISIAMLMGENGILGRAGQASETTKDVSEDEQVKLAVADALVNGTGTLSTDNVKKALENEFGTDKVTNDTFKGEGPWTFKGERNNYTINKNGLIESNKSEGVSYSELNVGDYISNYPVYYESVPSTGFGDGCNIPLDIYNNSWRILSVDEDNGIVRIVSGGTPLRYKFGGYGQYRGSWNFTTRFFDVEITGENFSIKRTGFKIDKSSNTNIDKIADLKNVFMNKYTAVNSGDETYMIGSETKNYKKGYPKVQVMTKEDLDSIFGYEVEKGEDLTENDLIAIHCKDYEGEYAVICLPGSSNDVFYTAGYKGKLDAATGFGGDELQGAKVVVELSPNLVFLEDENSINDVKTWHIE